MCVNYSIHPYSSHHHGLKILEKITSNQLVNQLEVNTLLYEHQYGFQRSKSTGHYLTHVTNCTFNALPDKQFCIGLFLDLCKAFDVCSHDILKKKLKKYGLKGNTHKWFGSYLHRLAISMALYHLLPLSTYPSSREACWGLYVLFLIYITVLHSASALLSLIFALDAECLAKHRDLNQ